MCVHVCVHACILRKGGGGKSGGELHDCPPNDSVVIAKRLIYWMGSYKQIAGVDQC